MSSLFIPTLGLDDVDTCPMFAAAWRDRTVIGGILGSVFDPEAKAEREACAREIERKEELRYQGVIILSDYRKDLSNGEI